MLLIPILGYSQNDLIKSREIKRDTVNKTVIIPYSTFLYLNGILENYLEYKKIEKNNSKIDSLNNNSEVKFTKILENFNKIAENDSINKKKLMQENLDMSNKLSSFAKQNKTLKTIMYPTLGFVIVRYVLIPSIKELLNK